MKRKHKYDDRSRKTQKTAQLIKNDKDRWVTKQGIKYTRWRTDVRNNPERKKYDAGRRYSTGTQRIRRNALEHKFYLRGETNYVQNSERQ